MALVKYKKTFSEEKRRQKFDIIPFCNTWVFYRAHNTKLVRKSHHPYQRSSLPCFLECQGENRY